MVSFKSVFFLNQSLVKKRSKVIEVLLKTALATSSFPLTYRACEALRTLCWESLKACDGRDTDPVPRVGRERTRKDLQERVM